MTLPVIRVMYETGMVRSRNNVWSCLSFINPPAIGTTMKNIPNSAHAGTFCCTEVGVLSKASREAGFSFTFIRGSLLKSSLIPGISLIRLSGTKEPIFFRIVILICSGKSSARTFIFSSISMPTITSLREFKRADRKPPNTVGSK